MPLMVMTKTVGIIAKSGSEEIARTAKELYRIVRQHNLLAIPDDMLARVNRLPGGKPLGQIKADILVTIGGDGTILRTVRGARDSKTPILGVNMGRRGYLTEVDPSGFEQALEKWMGGKFQVEKLWKLSVASGAKVLGEGLNEALLTPSVPAKMLALEVSLGEGSFYYARADGLIVATPTGSTAHAFSAGGPVLESSLDAFALTFLAPLQPVRSIVVPTATAPRVQLGKPGPDANLSIDGQLRAVVRTGQTLSFKRSRNSTFFVRFNDTFLQRSLRRLSPDRENI